MRRAYARLALLVVVVIAAPAVARAESPTSTASYDSVFPGSGVVPDNTQFRLAGTDAEGLDDALLASIVLRQGGADLAVTTTLTRPTPTSFVVEVVPAAPMPPGLVEIFAPFSSCGAESGPCPGAGPVGAR